MFEKLEIFQMASGLARHAAARQNTIARNVANADTPGYKAKDIGSFSDEFHTQTLQTTMRSTRAGHIVSVAQSSDRYGRFETGDPVSPNGNSVSLETEMMKASEVRHEHDLALAIYSKSLDILRASLGRR